MPCLDLIKNLDHFGYGVSLNIGHSENKTKNYA
jgi:hypothetical protein